MTKTQNPNAAIASGFSTDQLGGKIETKITQQIRQIKDAEAVTFDGRFLGLVLTSVDGRCDVITPSGRALGRFNEIGAAVRALLAEQQK